jgi:hypothetical protein
MTTSDWILKGVTAMKQRTSKRDCLSLWPCVLFCLLASTGLALGQDIATKGAIGGKVADSTGAVVPNAKVTVTGPTGERVAIANEAGDFELTNLIPGRYNVKAELSGFKSTVVPDVEVFVGKTSSLKLTLEAGSITEVVEVTAGAATVDTASTAVGANLNDQLYQNLPLQRSVTSLFYLAPGATDSLGGGRANPSISGGSALDNQYVADGVNITDSAFGGLGVFTRQYGTLGVGINTSYIKEVQVKTAGFEPQYGQATGGIINIITKSGARSITEASTASSSRRALRHRASSRRPENEQERKASPSGRLRYRLRRRRPGSWAQGSSFLFRLIQPIDQSRHHSRCRRIRPGDDLWRSDSPPEVHQELFGQARSQHQCKPPVEFLCLRRSDDDQFGSLDDTQYPEHDGQQHTRLRNAEHRGSLQRSP